MVLITRGVAAVVLVLSSACAGGASETGGAKVVAAVYPAEFLAKRIAGGDVEVTSLVAPGVEAHDMELTTEQIEEVAAADVVLYLGAGFQPAVERAAERSEGSAVDLLTAADPEGDDPHVWLDPARMEKMIPAVVEALSEAAPGQAKEFERRGARLEGELAELNGAFEAGLDACGTRVIVTTHDAFGYLGQRYRFEVVPISGLSPEAEPDPKRLASLVETVKARRVPVVFAESAVTDAVARTLAREAGADVGILHPLENLTGEQAGKGEDYLSLMRENLDVLREAMACT